MKLVGSGRLAIPDLSPKQNSSKSPGSMFCRQLKRTTISVNTFLKTFYGEFFHSIED